MEVNPPFAGTDRFQVLSELGTGGMGVVYEAMDRKRDTRVAVKTLRLQEARLLLRFKREFRAIRDLRHPNLVELGELFEHRGVWFFTMELVEGGDFLRYVQAPAGQDGPRFDETRLRHALAGLGAGLAALHRAGKVHCDIKPSNVMVTTTGRVVVLDFSVVTELDQDPDTGRRRIVGSPLYMAPEQIRGAYVGPAADWYGAGVLMFKAMTGDVPIRGRDTPHLLLRKVNEPAPHPTALVADLPEDLADLCHALLATSAQDRPGEAEILARLGVTEDQVAAAGTDTSAGRRLFVGRKDALAQLFAAYRDSVDGVRVSVFVGGESGVGKTALVERFIEQLREEHDVVVFRGQCHEREFVPYNAFDGIVDSIARSLRSRPWPAGVTGVTGVTGSAEILAPLLHLFPVLRGLPGLTVATGSVPGDVRRLAFFAFRQLLGWLAERGPLVLVVDDIHWADADSLMLLGELMNARTGPPLLLLCTARRLDSGRPCAAMRTLSGDVREIELGGLRGDEAEELAHRLFEGLSGGLVGDIATVVNETGGHPMFMDELVRYITRHATPYAGVRRAHLDDALRDRIAALADEARRVLELVVVAGAPLPREVIAVAADMPPDSFSHWLGLLRGAHLVRSSGPDEAVELSPYHARVREAVYPHVAPERRQALHGKLAAALEQTHAESMFLATHYHLAGVMDRAAHHAERAARKAAESMAFDQAAELYKLALSAVPASERSPDDQRRLLVELGRALQNAGRTREAAQAFTAAADMATPVQALDYRRRAAELLLEGGYLEQGVAAIDTVLAQSNVRMPRSGIWILPRVAWAMSRLFRRRLTWQTPPAEVQAGDAFKRAAINVDVCWSAGAGLSLVETVRGIYFATQGTELALRLGEPYRIARGLSTSSVAASALGKPEIGARMRQAAERAAREHGSNEAMFYAELARFVYRFFYEQTWRSCVAQGRELEGLWQAAGRGRTYEIDFMILFCSWAQGMLGDVNELARFVDMFVSDAKRVGNRLLEVSLRASHSLVHLAVDDPGLAREDILDAMESWLPGRDEIHLPDTWALINRADIYLYCGDPFAIRELDVEFRRMNRSPVHNTRWGLWQHEFLDARIAVARAAVHRARGERGGLRRELRNATRMARKLATREGPVVRLWGQLVRGCIAHIEGDDERAARELAAARKGFENTETMLHAQVSAYRLGQVLGGTAGKAMQEDARARIATLGIARPERIVAMLAPGW